MQNIFKKSKKDVARNEKSCTFAPAFGRNEGFGKKGYGKRKFFESLRPAQKHQRRGSGARDKGPLGNQGQVSRRNPRFRENKKQDNSTTKSLILAQDER